MPADQAVLDDILLVRYMEKLGIPYNVAILEPLEVVRRCVFIWSLDSERDKLEEKRRNRDSGQN